jgi:di/tricarboxylate transporter
MIPIHLQAYLVILIIVVAFTLIYKRVLKPTITLLLANLIFVLTGIISAKDLISGLSNEAIISIVLLILITAGVRGTFDVEMWFDRVYRNIHGYRKFLLAMMTKVAVVSSLMNNTPVVAAMIPYVFNWGKQNQVAPSKLLIPLSYATICGGMITLIGTSTTLVLNGFLLENQLAPLNVLHIFIIGIAVTLVVLLFIVIVGHKLLPEKSHLLDDFKKNNREYLVETKLSDQSPLAGKTVFEARLRNLPGVYLVEIIRDTEIISPVEPNHKIEIQDLLIFAGNTGDIMELVTSNRGLTLPESSSSQQKRSHRLVEVVVGLNSSIIGKKIKDSDFRNRYNAAIVAIHRNGDRLSGKIGEHHIQPGDLLLLYAGGQFRSQMDIHGDLVIISELKKRKKPAVNKVWGISIISLVALVLFITHSFTLFTSLLVIFGLMSVFKMMSMQDLKREVDLDLLAMLVFSLALGTAVVQSGAGSLLAEFMVRYFSGWGFPGILAALLIVTTLLTSFISNIGAVSVIFPIAMALNSSFPLQGELFYLGIAFAASAAFLTPIGYQTNLMVYGPGGYDFKDFFKAGLPVTFIYLSVVFSLLQLLY